MSFAVELPEEKKKPLQQNSMLKICQKATRSAQKLLERRRVWSDETKIKLHAYNQVPVWGMEVDLWFLVRTDEYSFYVQYVIKPY